MTEQRFELSTTIDELSFQAVGEPKDVMLAFEEFKVLVVARSKKPPGEKSQSSSAANSSGHAVPLPVFVKRAFSSQAAKATAIVLWARDNENKSGLRPSDIEAHWRRTPGKVPANPSQVCANAVTQGWLHGEGGGVYSVTGHGEEMVNSTSVAS